MLVRHGESEWNARKRWQGQADSPLSTVGRRQAAVVAERLTSQDPRPRFSAVWASDLVRAHSTAEVLASAVDVGTVRLDPRLREAEAGPWEGLTPDAIERSWPGWLARGRRPDGFEPADVIVARTLAVCHELLSTGADTDGAVMAVTHSGVIRTLRRHLGVDDVRVPNLGGVWFERTDDGRLEPLGWFDGTIHPASRPAPDPSPPVQH